MCANSSDRSGLRAGGLRQRGFTLAELVAVLVILGVLAVTALPKLTGSLALRNDAFRDQVVSGLRYARQAATSHRRLVCATLGAGSLSLSVASANPASACTTTLAGPDGQASYASNSTGIAIGASPTSTLYFQPSGRVSSDGAGGTVTDWTITVSGAEDAISVVGETGHVE
jgi:prepilin-type N-terminal cleavage/methylation domain-containing protein